MQVLCGHKETHSLAFLVSPLPPPLYLTPSPQPLTLNTSGKKTVMFLHLASCSVWEEASGREFDVWVTDPQVTLLGSAWSDQFEAENSPSHTGNDCCWAWLSSLFIFFFPWKFFCTNGYCVCLYLQEYFYISFSCFLSLQGKVVTFWRKLWILMNSSFSVRRCLFK